MGISGIQDLFSIRRNVETLQAGSRMGLTAYAYFLREKTLPASLGVCRPSLTKDIEKDPFSSAERDIEYFIPVTQTPKDAHGNDKGRYVIKIWLSDPYPHFEVPLDKTHFVIFSVGPDDHSEKAATCTQGRPGDGDYLLWPPPISLLRQYLLDNGKLK